MVVGEGGASTNTTTTGIDTGSTYGTFTGTGTATGAGGTGTFAGTDTLGNLGIGGNSRFGSNAEVGLVEVVRNKIGSLYMHVQGQ